MSDTELLALQDELASCVNGMPHDKVARVLATLLTQAIADMSPSPEAACMSIAMVSISMQKSVHENWVHVEARRAGRKQ